MKELNEAPVVVKIILITCIFIGVGMIFLMKTGEIGIKMFDCLAISNDTVLANDTAAQPLSHDLLCAVSAVHNNSNFSQTFASDNYSINMDAGTIIWTGVAAINGSYIGLNYTYYDKSREEYQTMNKTTSALGSFSEWWPLMILAFMIGIVLVIIFKGFLIRKAV